MKNSFRLLIALGIFIIPAQLKAQVKDEPIIADNEPRDTLVTFPGGDAAFTSFVRSKLYTTKKAMAAEVTGIASVQFTINEKGLAENITVINKVGYGCDEQAIRVIRLMPAWQPQVIGGRRIKSTITKDIRFDLSLPVAPEDASDAARETAANAPLSFGQQATDLTKYFSDNFKYPAGAARNMADVIVVKFKVGSDGRTSDINIISGISDELDTEAIRVIKEMPAWKPSIANFQPTDSLKELVIGFKNRKALLQ